GVTTNAHDGVRNATARHMHEVYTAMAEARMVLCLHGETPGEFVLDRETRFLSSLAEIAKTHPTLKIVLEHVTTADAVEWILRYQGNNVAATITAHHLDLTLDDVIGDMLRPHHFCKPVAKRPEDRQALWNAIQRGNPRFFLGSDSAPHLRIMKEHAEGCAGVFTAPILLPLLATLFERRTCLDLLESFTSTHGAAFYGLPLSDRKVKLERQPMTVPFEYSDVMDSGVVPLYAGKTLPWRLVV
ncbi:MAG TPA: dihydroorotase, partial [Candidatus Kapabacteria bacterium]|nr:dihydroorotase [Candidatus Kapabacteria bacterium]